MQKIFRQQLISARREKFAGCTLKVCFFARVIREKGLDDIVNALLELNQEYKKTAFILDIYGPIQTGEEAWFDSLQGRFDHNIKYKGYVEPEEGISVLRNYYALVFPTRYKTEGIPGTILDSFYAGMPVITSKWDNCADVFEEGVTGVGYEIGDYKALKQCLKKAYENPESLSSLKGNCLKKANDYSPHKIIKIMTDRIKT